MVVFYGCSSLEELVRRGIVLLDTNVLLSSINENDVNGRTYNSIERFHSESADFFIKKVSQNPGRVYITEKVVTEYLSGVGYADPFKRKKLIETFRQISGIVSLGEGEMINYDLVFSYYPQFREKYNLSPTDYDLLISGVVLGKHRSSCSVVSNDDNLLKALNIVACSEKLTKRQIGVYNRIFFESFKKFSF